MFSYYLFLLYCVFSVFIPSLKTEVPEDADLFITDLIQKYGYPVETHTVETEDGYILTMFRVPYGRYNDSTARRIPVLLMHGLMGSAENYLYATNNSLPYVLTDNGYDVWLGNARGNMHSRKHRTLNPDSDKKFWQFSWHEIGVYDQPAMIDYILEKTNQKSLFYIGHSQGTTSYFVMASERPEYNNKINLMIAMAPSALLKNMKQPILRFVAPLYTFLEQLANALNLHELAPIIPNEVLRIAGRAFCEEATTMREICANILFLLGGYDSEQLDRSVLPLMLASSPAGASTKQALHYAQLIVSGIFRQYDYGSRRNKKKYGSAQPPNYSFENMTAPIALFYGENDVITTTKDVTQLAKLLPNLAEDYLIPYKRFTHGDFVYAKDIMNLAYNNLLRLFKKYEDK